MMRAATRKNLEQHRLLYQQAKYIKQLEGERTHAAAVIARKDNELRTRTERLKAEQQVRFNQHRQHEQREAEHKIDGFATSTQTSKLNQRAQASGDNESGNTKGR